MSLQAFLIALFEHGRVRVASPAEAVSKAELLAADDVLSACESHGRSEFPGEASAFLLPCGRWAAIQFYRACQLAAFRDQQVKTVLSAEMPAGAELPVRDACPADVHYSVDLVFRFLPDLARLAAGVSREDPLLAQIHSWAEAWPLSSIGMKNVSPRHVDALLDHPGLLRYYADRVIARRDAARLDQPRVREAVRQAIGLYRELAPELAAALSPPTQGATT